MAKKSSSPAAPAKVSQLPIPISDSPLVIDLPDGQKLVIGKMAEGSVIEVATWRGTGRPDSRTSRLMLGMSPGNLSDDASETTGYAGGQKEKKLVGIAKSLAIIKNILKSIIKGILKLPVGKLMNVTFGKINLPNRKPRQRKAKESTSVSFPATTVISSTSSKVSKAETKEAVDDWLAQIIKKAESNSKMNSKGRIPSSPSRVAPAKKKRVTKAKKTTQGKKY